MTKERNMRGYSQLFRFLLIFLLPGFWSSGNESSNAHPLLQGIPCNQRTDVTNHWNFRNRHIRMILNQKIRTHRIPLYNYSIRRNSGSNKFLAHGRSETYHPCTSIAAPEKILPHRSWKSVEFND